MARWLGALALAWPAATRAGDSLWVTFSVSDGTLNVETKGREARSVSGRLSEAQRDSGRFRVGDRFEVGGDTLYVADLALPLARLGTLEVTREDGRVKVTLLDRGAASYGRPDVTGSASPLTIDSGRFVRGSVLGFGQHVEVAGEVNRSVVAFAGDVRIRPGGVVRGSVVAFGGDVHKTEDAFVYGDLYADNRKRFQPRWYASDEPPVDFGVALDYHRVTGGLVWANAEVGPKGGWSPRLALSGGYAFWPELWHYRLGLKRRSREGPLYYVGIHRDTKDDDSLGFGRHENTLFALLFGLDYRDYYFARGASASFGWSFSERRWLAATYVQEELSALDANQKQWSLFNGGSFQRNHETWWRTQDSSFRSDFDGRLAFLKLEAAWEWPEYAARSEGAWRVSTAIEWADSSLGSHFEYTRYGGRLSRVQPTWSRQELRARLEGTSSGGRLPATRTLYLGGPGTLRGFDHKEFLGNRSWVLNLEYGWQRDHLELFVLYDAGQVEGGNAPRERVLHNVGLGVQIQRTFRVQVAVDARLKRAPLVTVRFARTP